MIVVSDTSPITNLIEIGRLELLRDLFGEVFIPEIVSREATIVEAHRKEIENNAWIKVVDLKDRRIFNSLVNKLDGGEAEAIALALELSADVILIDEMDGRTEALGLGLTVTGLLGVLVRAKKQGLIGAIKPEIERLISDADFWVSTLIVEEALALAGEK